MTSDGEMSPSAFIPFCEFGDIKMGVKIDNFSAPVCNVFKAAVLNDQLCYEVDLDFYARKAPQNIQNKLYQDGFSFLMDYNEDRQIISDNANVKVQEFGLASTLVDSEDSQHANVYLNTIGKIVTLLWIGVICTFDFCRTS